VARTTVYHATEMDKFLEAAIRKHGFSVVETVSYCHTTFGRLNKRGGVVDMMRWLKDNSVGQIAAQKLDEEEKAAKIVRGVVCDVEKPEYLDLYQQVIDRAMEAK